MISHSSLTEEQVREVKLAQWDRFCKEHNVLTSSVPLFAADEDRQVRTSRFGKDNRLLLQRSPEMNDLIIREVEKILGDYTAAAGEYEGLIYLMFWEDRQDWQEEGRALPLYIGKSEKFGRGGGNLSANIHNIRKNSGKFCRWGDNYAYHIGDLSAVVCPGHAPEKLSEKYGRWARRLFEAVPSDSPRLVREVRFWAKAWKTGDIGIWHEYGATSLTFLEYLLIGVASDLFGQHLLNSEGVNRV